MVLAGTDNIRDVVAFPTTNSSMDLMSESPNEVDQAQLEVFWALKSLVKPKKDETARLKRFRSVKTVHLQAVML